MSDPEEKSFKKGCLVFLVVIAVLAAGAGLSVLLKGKKMKPKSRTLIVSRPQARLDEVKEKLSSDISPSSTDEFLAAFQAYTRALETHGSEQFEALGELGDNLARIEADGIITLEEAYMWAKDVGLALGAE